MWLLYIALFDAGVVTGLILAFIYVAKVTEISGARNVRKRHPLDPQ